MQQFYLFDFEGSLATSELMLPWIEAGIVVFHTLTYEGETAGTVTDTESDIFIFRHDHPVYNVPRSYDRSLLKQALCKVDVAVVSRP